MKLQDLESYGMSEEECEKFDEKTENMLLSKKRAEIYAKQRKNQKIRKRGRKFVPYQEYIKSEKWQQKRSLVMIKCGGFCEVCKKREATEVHHITYRNLGSEFWWQLLGVCKPCHEWIHGIDSKKGDNT